MLQTHPYNINTHRCCLLCAAVYLLLQMMVFLDHKAIADAAFVVSRMVAPAGMTADWLRLFAKVGQAGRVLLFMLCSLL